jgi:hypothetical protein
LSFGAVEKPVPSARATREREELRADLRTRAEQQADMFRAELDRLRAGSPRVGATEFADAPTAKPARRGTRGPAAQPRTATDQ